MKLNTGKSAGSRARGRMATAALAALLLSGAAACSSPEQKVEKFTKSGYAFLEKDDIGRANVQFQNALKINEEHVPALVGIADIAERKQDFQTMFAVLQQVVRLAPDNLDAQVKIGKLYLIGGDEKAALDAAEKSLALAAEDSDALALKAAVQLKLGDKAGAVELAKRALAKDKANSEAIAVLATERAADKDFVGALAFVDQGLAAKKDMPVLHLMRLQLLANLGRKADLDAAHQELIAIYPDNIAYRQIYVKTLIDDRKIDAARTQLEEIVKLAPDKLDPVLDVVRIDFRSGGADAAKKTFQRYIDAQPDNAELKFSFAAWLRQEKDFAGAEAIYQAMDKSAKDKALSRRARNEIAALRLIEGKKDEARKIVDAILLEDARDTDALVRLASLKIDAGDLDGAVTDLRSALNDKPDSTAAKMLIATAFEKKGDIEYATSQMAQAVIDSKFNAQATNVFAKFLIRRGDAPRAEKSLLDSLAQYPQDLENLRLLAAARLMQQNWRGAEETAKLIETVSADDQSVNRILGAAYTGLKDYSGAIDALTQAGEQAPLAAQPLSMLVSAYLADGRAAEAEAMLVPMVEKDGANYPARLLLARVYEVQKRPADVETTLKSAVAATPERGEAVEALYRIYRVAGRNAEAESLIEQAMRNAPANDGFKVLKADYLLSADRKTEAMAIYADVLTRRPNDVLVANNYASLLLEGAADPAAKAKALEMAKKLEGTENPYFLDTLGWAQYHNGDFPNAVATLEKATQGSPEFAEARYHLGAAYLANGDAARARAELEAAVSKGGQAKFVDEARQLLAQN